MAAVTTEDTPKEPDVSHQISSEDDSEVEQLLWTCKECYIYQIPPLKNESGHRANDWDVNKWLWSGGLRVTSLGPTLYIKLEDQTKTPPELFATCPVPDPYCKAVDPVVDSSRYFVLRIDDGRGKHAFVGMGFRDRNLSYDFNATLQDHWKSLSRQKEADAMRAEMEARMASEPMRDLSLKDGEKLSIKVNVPSSGKRRTPTSSGVTLGAGGLLPPPPGPGLLAPPPKAGTLAPPPKVPPAATSTDDFGDFGDFTEATQASGDDDDFGDFGDFAAAPPPEPVPPAEAPLAEPPATEVQATEAPTTGPASEEQAVKAAPSEAAA